MREILLATVALCFAACATHRVAPAGAGGWLDPWEHRHASPNGTPYVHPIGMEPAFLGREVLFSYHHQDAPGETENEVELELEWALTRRLGVAVEVPFARVSESGGATHAGIGDFAVAPRALLVETDEFLLSASVALTLPSGDSGRDLGGGEAVLGPALTTWSDLGNHVTLQARIGTQYGLETGDTLLDYHTVLIWALADDRGQSAHLRPGTTNLIAEFGGRTILDGPGETRTTAEVLLGASYNLHERWEVRGGWQFPVGGPRDIDHGFVVGAIFHF